MTEFLELEGGRIAYEVTGDGPLVVLLPGMGIRRDFYGSLSRQLVAAGYRVAVADLRGLGESSTGWSSYTRTATAADDRRRRALSAHPVPGPGRGRHAAVPEGARGCLERG